MVFRGYVLKIMVFYRKSSKVYYIVFTHTCSIKIIRKVTKIYILKAAFLGAESSLSLSLWTNICFNMFYTRFLYIMYIYISIRRLIKKYEKVSLVFLVKYTILNIQKRPHMCCLQFLLFFILFFHFLYEKYLKQNDQILLK